MMFVAICCAAVAAALTCTYGVISSATAQPKWNPVIATTAGGDAAQSVSNSAVGLGPINVETRPRVAPAQVAPLEIKPIAKGAWSTMITGALGEQAPRRRGGSGGPWRLVEQSERPPPPKPATEATRAGPASVEQDGAKKPAEKAGVKVGSDVRPGVAEAARRPLEALPPDATPVQQYCFNTADPAADARFGWQTKKIAEMEAELAKRISLLESKTDEYKSWLARRDDFSKRAHEKLVAFYARMRPDAAALQLAAMEDETAAAILTKLDAKVASLVMSEIEPARAAKLAAIISGAARVPPSGPRHKAASGGTPAKAQGDGAGPAQPQGDAGAGAPQGRNRS
jgi:flagellar motility protein MotE (MotC chaperone)